MNLAAPFLQTIHDAFCGRGHLLLPSLPDFVQQAVGCWQPTNLRPAVSLSYNFFAFARRLDQQAEPL